MYSDVGKWKEEIAAAWKLETQAAEPMKADMLVMSAYSQPGLQGMPSTTSRCKKAEKTATPDAHSAAPTGCNGNQGAGSRTLCPTTLPVVTEIGEDAAAKEARTEVGSLLAACSLEGAVTSCVVGSLGYEYLGDLPDTPEAFAELADAAGVKPGQRKRWARFAEGCLSRAAATAAAAVVADAAAAAAPQDGNGGGEKESNCHCGSEEKNEGIVGAIALEVRRLQPVFDSLFSSTPPTEHHPPCSACSAPWTEVWGSLFVQGRHSRVCRACKIG